MPPIISKPLSLSYLPQLSILEHLDSGQRILFSLSCPQIRRTENLVRLKIGVLTLYPLELRVNDTIFEIDFIRRYELAKHRKSELFSNAVNRIYFSDEEDSANSNKIISLLEEERKLSDQLNALEAEVPSDGLDELVINELKSIGVLSEELLDVRVNLQKIRPLPYTDYLQFSIANSTLNHVCLLEYTHSATQAMKHLVQCIFNGRKSVLVDIMDIGSQSTEEMSEKMKRKIDDWKISSTAQIIEQVGLVFTVNRLFTEAQNFDTENPLLQSVKRLTIYGKPRIDDILTLHPKDVHFSTNIDQLLLATIVWILDKHSAIGTHWSCDFTRNECQKIKSFNNWFPEIVEWLEEAIQIRETPGTRRSVFEHRFTCYVSGTNEVHIYCLPSDPKQFIDYGRIVYEVLPIDPQTKTDEKLHLE